MIPLNHAHSAGSDLFGLMGLVVMILVVVVAYMMVRGGLLPRAR